MDDPNAPSIWLIMGLGAALMGAFILLLWLNHKLVTWRQSKRSDTPAEAPPRVTSRPIAEAEAPISPPLMGVIMSRLLGAAGSIEDVADRLQAHPQNGVQGFANTRTPVNSELSAQRVAQPVIPEEARDIIQFWTKVAAVEHIIAGGKVGMVEAIELIFECKRNGRPDSVYGRARAAIQGRERRVEYVGDMIERINREVAQET